MFSETSSVWRLLHCVDDAAWWCSSSFPALALLLHYTTPTDMLFPMENHKDIHRAKVQDRIDSLVNQQEFLLLRLHSSQENEVNIQEAMTAFHRNSCA